jgi:hypothetical protein
MSLYKSLLRQLVSHNRDLLPVYYEKKLKGQEILNSEATARSLLELCFEASTTHFIVIDGLDEFSIGDRTSAVQFISSIVEKSDNKSPMIGKIRVLFMSQDLKDMRKLLPVAAVLEIRPSHVEPDIRTLVTQQAHKLASGSELDEGFELTEYQLETVKTLTIEGAKGMAIIQPVGR